MKTSLAAKARGQTNLNSKHELLYSLSSDVLVQAVIRSVFALSAQVLTILVIQWNPSNVDTFRTLNSKHGLLYSLSSDVLVQAVIHSVFALSAQVLTIWSYSGTPLMWTPSGP